MKTIMMTAAAIALMSGTAFATEHDWKSEFKSADTDSNGSLSMTEWKAEGDKMFKEIDTNGDGMVSMDEKGKYVEMKKD